MFNPWAQANNGQSDMMQMLLALAREKRQQEQQTQEQELNDLKINDLKKRQGQEEELKQKIQQNQRMDVTPFVQKQDAFGNTSLEGGKPHEILPPFKIMADYYSKNNPQEFEKLMGHITQAANIIEDRDPNAATNFMSYMMGVPIDAKGKLVSVGGRIYDSLNEKWIGPEDPLHALVTKYGLEEGLRKHTELTTKPDMPAKASFEDTVAMSAAAEKLGIPPEQLTDQQRVEAIAKYKQAVSTQSPELQEARTEFYRAMASVAPYRNSKYVMDSKTGKYKLMTAQELSEPGAGIPVSWGQMVKTAQGMGPLMDLAYNIQGIKENLPAIMGSPKIAAALKSGNGNIDYIIKTLATSKLSPQEAEGVAALKNLSASMLAARNFVGNFPIGSDIRVAVESGQLPHSEAFLSGNPNLANAQLKRLSESVRQNLRPQMNYLSQMGMEENIPEEFGGTAKVGGNEGKGQYGPVETKILKNGQSVKVRKNLQTGKYEEVQ